MKLVVLAGGFGTRLSAVVQDVPKPLAPVNGRPFLYYLIASWREQGIRDFVFLTHFMADKIAAFVEDLQAHGLLQQCEVQIIEEKQPLGTGGAVANAVRAGNITGSFLVANADTYMETGLQALQAAEPPAIATLEVADVSRYGAVNVNGSTIVSFAEKSTEAKPGYINAGTYHLHADMFDGWDGKAFSMEKDVFEELVKTGDLRAVNTHSVFIDIGIPADYHRFCRWIEAEKKTEL